MISLCRFSFPDITNNDILILYTDSAQQLKPTFTKFKANVLETRMKFDMTVSAFDIRRARAHGRPVTPQCVRVYTHIKSSSTRLNHAVAFFIRVAEKQAGSDHTVAIPWEERTKQVLVEDGHYTDILAACARTQTQKQKDGSTPLYGHVFHASHCALDALNKDMAIPTITFRCSPPDMPRTAVVSSPFPWALRDDIQRQAHAAVWQRWSSSSSSCSKHALLELPCNTGKTVVALHLAHDLVRSGRVHNVIVLTHLVKICEGWRETAAKVYGGSSDCVPYPLIVRTFQSFMHALANKKDRGLDRNTAKGSLSLLIVDEVHHVPANTFHKVVSHCMPRGTVPFRLGLTATLQRDDGLVPVIELEMGGKPVVSIQAKDVPGRYLDKLYIYHVKFPVNIGGKGSDQDNYRYRNAVHGGTMCRARWLLREVYHVCKACKYTHAKILVLEIKHMQLLLNTANALSLPDVVFACEVGKSNERAMRSEMASIGENVSSSCKQLKITIATIGMVGEGTHDDSIECLVFSEQARDMQQNGNRLRHPEKGMIMYVSSDLLPGVRQQTAKDIHEIRTLLFPDIKTVKNINVDLS